MGIRKRIARTLDAAGFEPADWLVDEAAWGPGYRMAGFGLRRVRLYHEGPEEPYFLDAYTGELRSRGYRVTSERFAAGTRRRLRVKAPDADPPQSRTHRPRETPRPTHSNPPTARVPAM
ncbi:hypothetical protein [Streptomyces sp. CA-111067]|uniref:hypothetical protein n=1 Tax=Streptomyces sp. CA-111067 TaxID=3240046 RepID=UPI003D95F3C9